MPNRIRVVAIRGDDGPELLRRARATNEPQRVVERAKIVLLAAQGLTGSQIARRLGCSEPTVVTWRRRYCEVGLAGLDDAPRPGAPVRTVTDDVRRAILAETLRSAALTGAGRACLSSRAVAERLERKTGVRVSHDSVRRVWHDYCLAPRGKNGLWLLVDPPLRARLSTVVGLYLAPPQQAVVVMDGTGAPAAGAGCGVSRGVDRCCADVRELNTALVMATRKIAGQAGGGGRPTDLPAFLSQAASAWMGAELHVLHSDPRTLRGDDVRDRRVGDPRIRVHRVADHANSCNLPGICFSIAVLPAETDTIFDLVAPLRAGIADFSKAWRRNYLPFAWLAGGQGT